MLGCMSDMSPGFLPRPGAGLRLPAPAPVRRRPFRVRVSTAVYFAIGITLLVLAEAFLPGGAAKVGQTLVGVLAGARAAELKLERQVVKRDPDEPAEIGPLARLGSGWRGIALPLVVFLAAAAALIAIGYAVPRAFGLNPAPYPVTIGALLAVTLLGTEWGLFGDD